MCVPTWYDCFLSKAGKHISQNARTVAQWQGCSAAWPLQLLGGLPAWHLLASRCWPANPQRLSTAPVLPKMWQLLRPHRSSCLWSQANAHTHMLLLFPHDLQIVHLGQVGLSRAFLWSYNFPLTCVSSLASFTAVFTTALFWPNPPDVSWVFKRGLVSLYQFYNFRFFRTKYTLTSSD